MIKLQFTGGSVINTDFPLNKLNTKDRILLVAEGFFQSQGYTTTTISQIAKASQITEATIYNHFTNKEDLLFAIAEKNLTRFCDSLEKHLLGIEGAYTRLTKVIWHHLMYMEDNSDSARLFILYIMSNIRFYKSKRIEPTKRYLSIIRNILKEGIDEGIFRKDLNIYVFQFVITGTINNIILSQTVRNRPVELLPFADALVKNLNKILVTDPDEETKQLGKRKRILLAALEEFGSNGYGATTVSQISSRAGITDPTIYEYFNGKEDILMSIPTLAVEELFPELIIDLDNINTPVNALKLYICNQIESYDAFASYSNVLITELRCNPNFYNSEGYNTIRIYTHILEKIIRWGISTGDFRADVDIDILKHIYFGTLDSLILNRAIDPDKNKLSDKFYVLFRMILNVLKPQ